MDKMENFIDTCVIIANFDEKNSFNKAAKEFTIGDQNVILCFYQKQKEIPYLIWRLKLKARVVKFKALMPSKEIPEIQKLTKEDKIKVHKMLANYELGLMGIKDIFDLQEQAYILEREINNFLKTKVKRFVIPLDKINENLVNSLFELNKNKADSKIIASAIQEHQKTDLILITLDKKDWKQEFIEKSCKKESYVKIPQVRFIQDS